MIVVTGASGNVGRPLVRALASAGEQVTAVSRRMTAEDLPAGVRHRRADLADPDSLRSSFDGAEALFLLTSGELAGGADGPQRVAAVLSAAKAGGVERVTLLSSQGVRTGRHAPGVEDAVKQSGLSWTMLQPGGFDSNTFQWAPGIRQSRTVTAPFGDVALPTVDPEDIAQVAAVTLRGGHDGRSYVLTGPAVITPRQQAAAIGQALGEAVGFVEQSRQEATAQLSQFMPEAVLRATLGILGEPTAQEQQVSQDIPAVLGREAGSFADWARRNAAAFA